MFSKEATSWHQLTGEKYMVSSKRKQFSEWIYGVEVARCLLKMSYLPWAVVIVN